MRQLRPIVSLLVLSFGEGCGTRVPLDQVPIEGGTPDQRDRVKEELEAFERWIGPERVALSGVRFAELGDLDGRYDKTTGRIRLDGTLPEESVRTILRHELCHALDFQEGLLDREVGPFEDLVSRIDADPDHPLHGRLGDGSARTARAEALANVCQQGPVLDALLSVSCGDGGDPYGAAAVWTTEQVWTGEPDLAVPAAWASGVAVAARIDERPALDALTILGSRGAEQGWFVLVDSDGSVEDLSLDLVWGEPVERVADPNLDAARPPFPALPVGLEPVEPFAPEFLNAVSEVRSAEIVAAIVRDAASSADLGLALSPRVIALDDGVWSVVDGACPTEVSSVFVAAGAMYLGWAESGSIRWSRIERSPQ